jgi:hypothetical protein
MIRKVIILALLTACITMTGGCKGTGSEQTTGRTMIKTSPKPELPWEALQ